VFSVCCFYVHEGGSAVDPVPRTNPCCGPNPYYPPGGWHTRNAQGHQYYLTHPLSFVLFEGEATNLLMGFNVLHEW
jgi:hypothetical protein